MVVVVVDVVVADVDGGGGGGFGFGSQLDFEVFCDEIGRNLPRTGIFCLIVESMGTIVPSSGVFSFSLSKIDVSLSDAPPTSRCLLDDLRDEEWKRDEGNDVGGT